MKTKCSVCAEMAEVEWHHFYEGLGYECRPRFYKPVREWQYGATLWHHPATHAPYCGPTCATKALTSQE